MSMTPRGWSISALAVELGADRRTIARAIADAGVRSVDETGGAALYGLRDVLDALELGGGRRRSGRPAPRRSRFDEEDDRVVDRAFALYEGEVWRRAARLGLISMAEAEELARKTLVAAPVLIPLHDDDEADTGDEAA